VKLGTMVIVPTVDDSHACGRADRWLDHLSGGRLILDWAVVSPVLSMKAFALTRTQGGSVLLNTLSSSWMASKGYTRAVVTLQQPRRDIRPLRSNHFGGHLRRGGSPQSMPIMAKLGVVCS